MPGIRVGQTSGWRITGSLEKLLTAKAVKMDRQVRKEIAFLSASFAIYSRASAVIFCISFNGSRRQNGNPRPY